MATDGESQYRMTVGDGFRLAFGSFLFSLVLAAVVGVGYLLYLAWTSLQGRI